MGERGKLVQKDGLKKAWGWESWLEQVTYLEKQIGVSAAKGADSQSQEFETDWVGSWKVITFFFFWWEA